MARRKADPIEGQLDLFEFLYPNPQEVQDEQLRRNREEELAAPSPQGPRTDGAADGSESLLPGSGESSLADGDGPGGPVSSSESNDGQLLAERREVAGSPEDGRGVRHQGAADPAAGELGAGGGADGYLADSFRASVDSADSERIGDSSSSVTATHRGPQPGGNRAEPSGLRAGGSPLPQAQGRTGTDDSSRLAANSFALDASLQGSISVPERYRRNVAALETLAQLQSEDRAATETEKQVLAQYSGWGAGGLSEIFNEANPETEPERFELKELLGNEGYRAAAKGVNYAHYTEPAYIKAIWDGLKEYGFEDGKVLEPGSGIGNFIGMSPTGAQMTGIEIDPTSAAISSYLYPEAMIRNESFADSFIPTGYFDAAVGNVPFSQTVLHDPRHNAQRHSMHNHFILKSLDLTKPGGVVALITSTGTLDATGSAARQAMYEQADLLGAYRLPEQAFGNAGTSVMTDLLIFRKREENQTPLSGDWVQSIEKVTESGQSFRVNAYFEQNPQNLLGETDIKTDRFGNVIQSVNASKEERQLLPQRLAAAIKADLNQAQAQGYQYVAAGSEVSAGMPLLLPEDAPMDEHISIRDDGSFAIYKAGAHQDLHVPQTQIQEIKSLLSMRDQAKALLAAEATGGASDFQMENARTQLRQSYEQHLETYGPLNGGKISYNEEGEISVRRRPVMSIFRKDPFSGLVFGLENYSRATNTATPADLLKHRMLEPRKPVTEVDNALDALTVSLDVKGKVDVPFMAELMKATNEKVVSELEERIFLLPGSDFQNPEYQTAEEYLSGNVKKKLQEAAAAAEVNPHFQKHVEALQQVIPEDIAAVDITVQPGAVWIPDEIHQQFLREELGDRNAQLYRVHGGTWELLRSSKADPNNYGTDHRSPAQLFLATIEKKPIKITSEKKIDPKATAYANSQAERISERFAAWVWEDPERHQQLLRAYNDTHNNYALRNYEKAGQALTLPGLVKSFVPHAHQRTAVARMLAEPSVGLFHEVGAGKTAEMVMGTMELKRLGLIKKPAILVPNHMLEQFSREWLELYPQARVLAASSADIGNGDVQREFIARVATNEWDAVIMTHAAFGKLQLSPENKAAYLSREVELLEQSLNNYNARLQANGQDGKSVKEIQDSIDSLEQQIKNLQDAPSTSGLTFEETGIDYLCVDEMHEFKNLKTYSSIPGAKINGSQKATNLHSVIEYLRQTNGDRVVTAATGTPVANSMTELYVMNRYLAPELLREQGLEDFDSWAATYGKTVTELELTVAGGDSYKMTSRFSKFVNIPELIRTMHTYGDVKLADDLTYLKRPELEPDEKGERVPHVLSLKRSQEQAAYIETLAERYENLSGPSVKGGDNPLVITSDGRKVAADYRLIDPGATLMGEVPTKAEATAQVLAEVYEKNKDKTYLIPGTEEVHPNPGALQVVFCDYGVPGKSKDGQEHEFDMYNELKKQCVLAGIPEEKIKFIQDADTEAKKASLFQQCRDGEVAVLIGSTQRMGTGTNIQNRLVHLVHMDAPWRPADLEQRNGRILRPGNQNQQVRITQAVTRETFDAVMWSTLLRKQRFISQVMRGDMSIRTMDDLGKQEVSMAQTQAIATGNPFIVRHADAQAKVQKLRSVMAGHENSRRLAEFNLETNKARAQALEKQIPLMKQASAQIHNTSGENFSARMGSGVMASRSDTAEALHQWAESMGSPSWVRDKEFGPLVSLGGITFVGKLERAVPSQMTQTPFVFHPEGMPWAKVEVPYAQMQQPNRGLVTRLENLVASLPEKTQALVLEQEGLKTSIEELTKKATAGFEQMEELKLAEAEESRLRALADEFKTASDEKKEQMLAADAQVQIDLLETLGKEQISESTENKEKVMEQGQIVDMPNVYEAFKEISEKTGIQSSVQDIWGNDIDVAYDKGEPEPPAFYPDKTEEMTGLKVGRDIADVFTAEVSGDSRARWDVQALYDEHTGQVSGYLLGDKDTKKVFALDSFEELQEAVHSRFLEDKQAQLTEKVKELSGQSKEQWDEYGQLGRLIEQEETRANNASDAIFSRERLIEQEANDDFARLREAKEAAAGAGFFERGRRQEELEAIETELAQKYHGASSAYEAMKQAKENDPDIASWKQQREDIRGALEDYQKKSSEVMDKINSVDKSLKDTSRQVKAVKQQRLAVDSSLRAQYAKGAEANRAQSRSAHQQAQGREQGRSM